MKFFLGWHQPCNGQSGAGEFERAFISVRRLWKRKSDFQINEWILDSGAFKELELYGDYTFTIKEYAEAIIRWSTCGQFLAAVSQDFMCEQYIFDQRFKHKGIRYSIPVHQRMTICHYDKLRSLVPKEICIIPVLQGLSISDYLSHLDQYGDRLTDGMWIGVGSVCKRQGNPVIIEDILLAIKQKRPDLRLHGFGIKSTALKSGLVWDLLYSADSQANSFHQRMTGTGKANCPLSAIAYASKIIANEPQYTQMRLV